MSDQRAADREPDEGPERQRVGLDRHQRLVMRALLVLAVALYVLVIGQNWGWYAGALMLGAIRNDARR